MQRNPCKSKFLVKQGKPCKLSREKMLIKQGYNGTKTEKRCYYSRENPVIGT
jgi:hypothetical protein